MTKHNKMQQNEIYDQLPFAVEFDLLSRMKVSPVDQLLSCIRRNYSNRLSIMTDKCDAICILQKLFSILTDW